MKKINKVLLLGSGALKIGQAGEFDYSGSQAIKALKEEGIKTILVNPNIATVQTSANMADEVYFVPVTPEFVEKVIEREKPQAILLAFGGQTALNCGTELYKRGVLERYGVEVLGTPVPVIELTEDRQLFADHLRKIHIPTPRSKAVKSVVEAVKAAEELGYPVMMRAAFALGGEKSGVVSNEKLLRQQVAEALLISPQVLVEAYLHHYKEIEYEVIRDRAGNALTVCNMENMDPLGIHTGESIVVAPSQTLTDDEYQTLRKASLTIAESLGIVGECNVQYAVEPNPKDGLFHYEVIEVNARLSRSSALASKATGYPLAYVAAKLALGQLLHEIPNQITRVTQSYFEPALDYVVVKLPRWDLDKFSQVDQRIGSSMKSVGEVMAIGRSFEEAIQKAVRMLSLGYDGITDGYELYSADAIRKQLNEPTHRRLFALVAALFEGIRVEELHGITGIDRWFLDRLVVIVEAEKSLRSVGNVKAKQLLPLKRLGFSDARIGKIVSRSEREIRALRQKAGVTPSIFQIDTLAGEFPAETNYLYTTYWGEHHDVKGLRKDGVIVLGSGPYRIGSSVEFDWSCVFAAQALTDRGKDAIVINCNPETVSTDYDMSARLYFEELTLERVLDIYEFEQSEGVLVSFGGQIANNLVKGLHQYSIPLLGTAPEMIDEAENRKRFSDMLDRLGIKQPQWAALTSIEHAEAFVKKVGYPVLVRPSYVLSGDAMRVCYSKKDVEEYLASSPPVQPDSPVVITQYIEGAEEIEFDGVAQKGEIKAFAICEHLEHAGVHSGDATIIYPPQKMYVKTERQVRWIAGEIARALMISGPFNLQLMAKDNQVYVIEANVRASRTLPFVSKAMGINFATLAVEAIYGRAKELVMDYPENVAVKVPQFSFSRLSGADPLLRVEMASTGEAAAFGVDLQEAFLKAEMAVGALVPKRGIFISLGGEENKIRFLEHVWRLKQLKVPIYATGKTALFLQHNGIRARRLYKIHEGKTPNVLSCFQAKKVDLAINVVDAGIKKEVNDDYAIRRAAIDQHVYLITDRQKASLFMQALVEKKFEDLSVLPWSYYV